MTSWYNNVVDDIDNIPAFIAFYESELEAAKSECRIRGSLEKSMAQLPGITEHRFNQLQEIEAILEHLGIQLRRIRRKYFQQYLEKYNRALSSRDAEKYVDGEAEVVDYEILINTVALLRNKYLGVIKGLESRNFMSGHIVRLRTASMENISI